MHIFVALSLSHALDKVTYEGKRGLSQNRFHFEAIVYCTHKGAPDIVKSLLKTGLLVIQVTKQIIYRQKQRDYWCSKQYGELNQEAALVLKTLDISFVKGKVKLKVGKRQR